MGPSVPTPTIPQNATASGYFRFQTNMLRPCLFATRGSAGGRWGHGLSLSFRVSETMLSIFTLSVTPACLRLSVRVRFTLKDRDKPWPQRPPALPRVANKQGLNMFVWNLKYPDAVAFWGMVGVGTDG